MERKEWNTTRGKVVYWISELKNDRKTLAFLPGLSAEHHLFDEQICYFEKEYNCFTWDAPAHAESRPYADNFSLKEDAEVLHSIFSHEGIEKPIIIGQSFGAYIAQMYMELYPVSLSGFVSIDSAPIQVKYYTSFDLWFFKNMEWMYAIYPNLVKSVVNNCAETERGRKNMTFALSFYSRKELSKLTGQGYMCLYEAIIAKKPYLIDCPALLICGEQDKAGYTKKYNVRWSESGSLPLVWVKNAGHNSNIDQPDFVNMHIQNFLTSL